MADQGSRGTGATHVVCLMRRSFVMAEGTQVLAGVGSRPPRELPVRLSSSVVPHHDHATAP
jgi:hypothetical protein